MKSASAPTVFVCLCRTDAEHELLFFRLDGLATMEFEVHGTGTSYVGRAVRRVKGDRQTRLVQIQFLETLLVQLRLNPPLAGSPEDFEETLHTLEEFVADHMA